MKRRAETSTMLALAAVVAIAFSATALANAADGRVAMETYVANVPGSCGIVPHVAGGASACFGILAGERTFSVDINDGSDSITGDDPTDVLFGSVPFLGIYTGTAQGQIRFCGDTPEIWIPEGATEIQLLFWTGNCSGEEYSLRTGLVTRGELRVEFAS